MLKGFLAGGQVATSFAYNNKIINRYLKEADHVFSKIKICLKWEISLKGEIKHSTLKDLQGKKKWFHRKKTYHFWIIWINWLNFKRKIKI